MPATDIVHAADPNSQEALDALRHSCAHVLAQAVQELFPGTRDRHRPLDRERVLLRLRLTAPLHGGGPPQDREADAADRRGQPYPFVGKEVAYEESKKAYWAAKGETYKVELLEGFKDQRLTHYSHGTFTDLCRGGHTPSTKAIRHFKILSVAGAYWRGDEKNQMLQRLYATAWPTKEQLAAHLGQLEEAKKRDHRKLGPALGLFSIQDLAGPGLIFWHPKGGRMRLIMEDWLRAEARSSAATRWFTRRTSPTWTCGTRRAIPASTGRTCSAEIEVEKADYQLKPMNCPFHILIFQSGLRSYKDLPLRYSETRDRLSLRALRRPARPDARARLHPGRRPHLLRARVDRGRGRGLHRFRAESLRDLRLREIRDGSLHLGSEKRRTTPARPRSGTARRAPSRRCSSAGGSRTSS